MEKINIGTNGFVIPMPQTILGTTYTGKPNYMALAWTIRVNHSVPLVCACVNKKHASCAAILEHREFSINIPSQELLKKTDYVGIVSAHRTDKSAILETWYGTLKHAPLVRECPLSIECALYKPVELPSQMLFIGEIIATWCDQDCLSDGQPDLAKLNPFVLTLPDRRYWSIGKPLAKAWHAGKSIR